MGISPGISPGGNPRGYPLRIPGYQASPLRQGSFIASACSTSRKVYTSSFPPTAGAPKNFRKRQLTQEKALSLGRKGRVRARAPRLRECHIANMCPRRS
uniref:Uncharacterized protein n=1 Tax=Panagrellus redivivus TaxID=6233 RepID=A0A7E4V3N9_PANRE